MGNEKRENPKEYLNQSDNLRIGIYNKDKEGINYVPFSFDMKKMFSSNDKEIDKLFDNIIVGIEIN